MKNMSKSNGLEGAMTNLETIYFYKEEEIKKVCAWCNASMEEEDIIQLSKKAVSHGICKKCKDKVLSEFKEKMLHKTS